MARRASDQFFAYTVTVQEAFSLPTSKRTHRMFSWLGSERNTYGGPEETLKLVREYS